MIAALASVADRILSRFGAFSPRVTLTTFAPGARELLAAAERSGEIALHAVRGGLWTVILVGTYLWFELPSPAMALGVVILAGVWTLALGGLRGARLFTPTRYLLILLDGLLIIRGVFIVTGPSAEVFRSLAEGVGLSPSVGDIQAYVPPMLVFLALSGALRLDPRPAFLAMAVAVSGYAYYALTFEIPSGQAFLVGGLVLFSGIVGTNAARVLRYMVLKASAEAVLERYVPQSLGRDLIEIGKVEVAARVGPVTLLLSDVRGFTPMSERLTPTETVALVNDYLATVCPAIIDNGGVIDKYMGDGVLAFFEGGGHEARALRAARAMVAAIERSNRDRPRPLRIGVALHSGVVLVGTIGPRGRHEYTIISDAVNVVSRLEELNKRFGSSIVASAATVAGMAPEETTDLVGPVEVNVRGREGTIAVHHLPGRAS